MTLNLVFFSMAATEIKGQRVLRYHLRSLFVLVIVFSVVATLARREVQKRQGRAALEKQYEEVLSALCELKLELMNEGMSGGSSLTHGKEEWIAHLHFKMGEEREFKRGRVKIRGAIASTDSWAIGTTPMPLEVTVYSGTVSSRVYDRVQAKFDERGWKSQVQFAE